MDLRKIGIFEKLTDKDLEIIRENLSIEEKIFEKGSYIFMQKDLAVDLFYLEKGDIIVEKIDSSGKRYIVQNFKKDVIFGEVYAYLHEAYDFSAYAKEDSKVYLIKDFKKLFSLNLSEDFLLSFIDLLAKKCMVLSRKNQISTQFTLRQKIANFLLYKEEKGRVDLKMTREDLADFLSTTRPSLSRELSKMDEEGLIKVQGKKIQILDKRALEDLAY